MAQERHDRRPYFRTADSVWREPWDNNVLALAARLSAYMHERWRTERINDPAEASRVIIPHGVLCALAGTHEMRTARARYAALSAHITLSVSAFDAHRMQIIWPKWADFQGLDELNAGKSPANPRQSASSVQRPSIKRKKKREIACPETLDLDEWEKVSAWARKTDPVLAQSLPAIWEEVRAWAESNDIRRPGWAATLRTFFLKRTKEKTNGTQRPANRGGRRQTAVEAGREILDELRRRSGADADVHEALHALPALGDAGPEGGGSGVH